jgi:uncharacterized repeat protein (TIGR03803 family)
MMLRRYLIIGIVAMLAGCGGSQPPITTPGAIPQSRASSGYNALYSFGKRASDGQQPKAGLIDLNGTLYGTTYDGGKSGGGAVFSINTHGAEKVVYSFDTFGKPNDGLHPSAGLVAARGVLYGTTEYGGGEANLGTVFKVSTAGQEMVLHSFLGYYYHEQYHYDGANPVASLIAVRRKLYGTTSGGGTGQFYGTVFRITTSGNEKVLYSFGYYGNGAAPVASLLDVNGTLYGTTQVGGGYTIYSGGTVFGISAAGAEQKLYTFGYNGPNGSTPSAALINVGGTLYGTAEGGGSYSGGAVFSITTSGDLETIYSFGNGSDGRYPFAPLLNVGGTLYGTTSAGGVYGKGTVFSVTLSGSEKVLHSFGYGSDGATPLAGLTDVNGTLYGTTSAGGTYGDGTVFALRLGSK